MGKTWKKEKEKGQVAVKEREEETFDTKKCLHCKELDCSKCEEAE
jgi:hypothetical protein